MCCFASRQVSKLIHMSISPQAKRIQSSVLILATARHTVRFEEAASQPNLDLLGVHSHIGSQIFEVEGFAMAVDKVVGFAIKVREELNVTFTCHQLGRRVRHSLCGRRYSIPIAQYVKAITESVITNFTQANYPLPEIWVEPGRSMVGDAGTTLYTVGTSKEIPGVRKYVAVDGGMTDNPRFALYESRYEAVLANRVNDAAAKKLVSVAGKCCESGDMLIWDLSLPKESQAIYWLFFAQGAYNYAMASNYNRIRRPAVVFVKDGQADLVSRTEIFRQYRRQ